MILIFGGAYQGKREYAERNFSLECIYDCRDNPDENCAPDLTADAICGLECFSESCCRQGIEAAEWFRQHRQEWEDKILIMRDVSQGIVPVDPQLRAAREMNGRLMIYLAGEAEQVVRVFCGIGRRIK